MDLAEHQRKILAMIKGTFRPEAADDAYLRAVDGSPHLALVREIATWWRIFDLERYCALTSRLLKLRGAYEATVEQFVQTHAISPFINEVSESFLLSLGEGEDALLAEVALFELALTRVKRGDPASYTLDWSHDPARVLTCLANFVPFTPEEVSGSGRVVVSRDLPGDFSISYAG